MTQISSNNLFENAEHICFEELFQDNNVNSNSTNSNYNINFDSIISCINIDRSSWYKFPTNNDGGEARILINQINCNGDSNLIFQNNIEVVVFYQISNNLNSGFSILESCQTNNNFISFELSNLLENKDYYILVDGYSSIDSIPINTNCSYSIQISGNGVRPNISAGKDIFMFPGDLFTLNGLGNGTPNWEPSYFMDSSNIFNPSLSIHNTTEFLLTVTDINGCKYEDLVVAYVEKNLILYNTITPNNDGNNDEWIIENIENYPNCIVNVYNIWGKKVFESFGYNENKRWDGTINGDPLPTGTYFFTIETMGELNNQSLKGKLNLLR